MAWEKVERGGGQTEVTIGESHPINARNLHYAVIDIVAEGNGVRLMNLGFNSSIPVKQSDRYLFSIFARRDASFDEPLPGGYDPHHNRIVPIDELSPWIQDALDLLPRNTLDTMNYAKNMA